MANIRSFYFCILEYASLKNKKMHSFLHSNIPIIIMDFYYDRVLHLLLNSLSLYKDTHIHTQYLKCVSSPEFAKQMHRYW